MADHPNWKALATVDFQWKQFVKGSSDNADLSKGAYNPYMTRPGSRPIQAIGLTGIEAKQIYDDVVELSTSKSLHDQHKKNSWEDTKIVTATRPTPKARRLISSCSPILEPRPRLESHSRDKKDLSSHCLYIPVDECDSTTEVFDLNLQYHLSDDSRQSVGLEKESKVGLGLDPHLDQEVALCQNQVFNYEFKCEKISASDTFPHSSSNVETGYIASPRLPKYVPDVSSLNSVMKEIQRNNLEFVQKHIESGIDINVVDGYGWTMLMVAACAGAVDVVKLLLMAGANLNVKDRSGYSCYSLAKRHNHLHILEVLNSYKQIKNKAAYDTGTKNTKSVASVDKGQIEDFYCDTCNRSFCETTREKHLSSTVHLFNSRPRSLGTIYGIPECNVGYQILLKRGWDKESGLGRDGTGQKFPCKTVLKRDRKGLGVEQPKPRVTHFEPKEVAAIRHGTSRRSKPCRPNKKNLAKIINREKLKERKLRNELS